VIPANRQRNYLQSALYVIIAGLCAGLLLERLLVYAEAAEKAAMEATLSRLHAALYTRVAYLALRNEHAAIEALRGESPFRSTGATADNYLGEFDGIPGAASDRQWLFDRTRRELVYLPRLARHLEGAAADAVPKALRFKVDFETTASGGYRAVTLAPAAPYRWQP
jgi:hypothetical protein